MRDAYRALDRTAETERQKDGLDQPTGQPTKVSQLTLKGVGSMERKDAWDGVGSAVKRGLRQESMQDELALSAWVNAALDKRQTPTQGPSACTPPPRAEAHWQGA